MAEPSVIHRLNSLADASRARLLHVLGRHELTVSELCAVVQLPQSTVSRHLRVLAAEGWVVWRAEGTSRHYRLATELDAGARRLWEVVRAALSEDTETAQDEARVREVLSRRRTRSQEFFATAAGQWDSLRAELFGERPEAVALLALLDRSWVVGELGCGTGQLAATLAPYVSRVVAVDESPDMLAAARRRLGESGNVELRQGRLEALPLADGALDVALFSLVLHYVPSPLRALEEAGRVLRPGGRVLVVDMAAHGRVEYRERMGHLWPGFERNELAGWLSEAGFEGFAHWGLPPEAGAKGPVLFAAVAAKSPS